MIRQFFLVVLLSACQIASVVNAQSGTKAPLTSTEALFEYVNKSVCTIISSDEEGNAVGQGSGFILRNSGFLVTNAHVLSGIEEATVKCGDQYGPLRSIVRYDNKIDLVVVSIDPLNIEGLDLTAKSEVAPGTQVYAFGSPLGLEGTISPGLASGQRNIAGATYIQISAPISPGSSGGPVTDASGSVIAVTVGSFEAGQNINFAVPASVIVNLPSVDMQVAELRFTDSQQQYDETPSPPKVPTNLAAADFRGYPFGSDCNAIARLEYDGQSDDTKSVAQRAHGSTNTSELEASAILFGQAVKVVYTCKDQFGLVSGKYVMFRYQKAAAETMLALAGC